MQHDWFKCALLHLLAKKGIGWNFESTMTQNQIFLRSIWGRNSNALGTSLLDLRKCKAQQYGYDFYDSLILCGALQERNERSSGTFIPTGRKNKLLRS